MRLVPETGNHFYSEQGCGREWGRWRVSISHVNREMIFWLCTLKFEPARDSKCPTGKPLPLSPKLRICVSDLARNTQDHSVPPSFCISISAAPDPGKKETSQAHCRDVELRRLFQPLFQLLLLRGYGITNANSPDWLMCLKWVGQKFICQVVSCSVPGTRSLEPSLWFRKHLLSI